MFFGAAPWRMSPVKSRLFVMREYVLNLFAGAILKWSVLKGVRQKKSSENVSTTLPETNMAPKN